jgi:hypothetical protein
MNCYESTFYLSPKISRFEPSSLRLDHTILTDCRRFLSLARNRIGLAILGSLLSHSDLAVGQAFGPVLAIRQSQSHLVLSWPAMATGLVLETTSALLSNSVWFPVTNGVLVSGTNSAVSLPAPASTAFYRSHGAASLGNPITAPEKFWTWVPFADAFCMEGTTTGIGVNLSSSMGGSFLSGRHLPDGRLSTSFAEETAG